MVSCFEILNSLITAPTSSIASAANKQQQMETEVKKLPHKFANICFSEIAPEKILQSVQYAQASTSFLLNKIEEQESKAAKNYYKETESILVEFINTLIKNFPTYIEYSLPMPQVIWLPIKNAITTKLKWLVKLGLDEVVESLLLRELNSCSKTHTPNYIVGYYWKNIFDHFNDFSFTEATVTNDVIELLVRCNFNSRLLTHYVIDNFISAQTEESSSNEYFTKLLTTVSKIPVYPHIYLYENEPTAKQQLLDGINMELFAAEAMAADIGNIAKMQTSLSVGQLSVFIRLMIDTNIVQTQNVTNVLRFYSKNFKTTRTAQISETSLRQRYYNADAASISILRTHLSNMLNKLKGY